MPVYGKLVRDKIPDVIKRDGGRCDIKVLTKVLDREEWLPALIDKLGEEVAEFAASQALEELADIVEVIRGILGAQGLTWDSLEETRRIKADERGGFEERIWLIATEP